MVSIMQLLKETFSSTQMEVEAAKNVTGQAKEAVERSHNTRLWVGETRAAARGTIECARGLRQSCKLRRGTHAELVRET